MLIDFLVLSPLPPSRIRTVVGKPLEGRGYVYSCLRVLQDRLRVLKPQCLALHLVTLCKAEDVTWSSRGISLRGQTRSEAGAGTGRELDFDEPRQKARVLLGLCHFKTSGLGKRHAFSGPPPFEFSGTMPALK